MRSFRRGREIRRELWISALVSAQYVVNPLNGAIDSYRYSWWSVTDLMGGANWWGSRWMASFW